jgi:hypothetical protein
VPWPSQISLVHTSPSSVQHVFAAVKQFRSVSLHVVLHSAPPAHGSPACRLQLPPLQVSLPLQKTPSSHGAVLFGWVHAPAPSQTSSVQGLVSALQAVPAEAKQFCASSLQALAHSGPDAQGSPGCPQLPLQTS